MIAYHVRSIDGEHHQVHVRVELPTVRGTSEVHLPAWSPGSYLIRDYARHLNQMEAHDARGRSLAVEKIGKHSWRVSHPAGRIRLDYAIYGFERSVRTSHVTSDHAFLHGPTLFVYRDSDRAKPCTLQVEAPRGFRVACALPVRGKTFHAANYDELIDSPIECGRPRELKFTVAETPFRVLLCGPNALDSARFRRDFARIARAQRDMFGGFPFSNYLALINFTSNNRGGLEHRASMAVEWPGQRFHGETEYQEFLQLISHELFHAWNIKASRPHQLQNFDYNRECPTRLLWWYEGVTDYYASLTLRRAGILTPIEYLKGLADSWDRLMQTPGRLRLSVAEASFDAWIRLYRPDENSVNTSVSYYLKGHLLGALLDLELRSRSGGKVSLDDVARRVDSKGRRGLPEDGIEAAAATVLGAPLTSWFRRYVHGTAELPFAKALQTVGLRLEEIPSASGRGAALGAILKTNEGRVQLANVLAGGAADRAGLSAGDQLIALDRHRVDLESLQRRLADTVPGTRVTFSYFRHDTLREIEVETDREPGKTRIVRVDRPTRAANTALCDWLSCEPAAVPSAQPDLTRTKPPAS